MSQKGHIEVGDGHTLYYERHGDTNGIPVLFILGGPGLGFSSANQEFFDLDKVDLILYEQRGCGRSTPNGSIENNTTEKLIHDISILLDHFSLSKVVLFGGSWGSTLSLLYAIRYPERVLYMVLRGIFTASKSDRAHFETGGNQRFFPQIWHRFTSHIPENHNGNPSYFYFQKILNGSNKLQDKLAYELMYYGIAVSKKTQNIADIELILSQSNYLLEARILSHYSVNDFFLHDNFIINNIDVIKHIPTHIVQGRYDMITTPNIAYALHERLENSVLHLVESGHSQGEEQTKSKLIEIMKILSS